MPPDSQSLQYPIGRFERPAQYDPGRLVQDIASIQSFPERLTALIQDLPPEGLDWVYRPGGWNLRQLIHHCADSHMNAFIRFRLALTEDNPVIKPYQQDGWARLADSLESPVEWSVELLHGLHRRWQTLMQPLTPSQWGRTAFHPEQQRPIPLWEFAALYSWHSHHHLAHLEQGITFRGKFA